MTYIKGVSKITSFVKNIQMLTRKPKTEWAANAVHEYKELLRDAALYLIQEADKKDRKKVEVLVCKHIEEVRKYIGELFRRDLEDPDFELDEVYEIDPEKISTEALIKITEEIELLRKDIQRVLSSKNYFEQMNDSPFILMGLLRSIMELKKKLIKEV